MVSGCPVLSFPSFTWERTAESFTSHSAFTVGREDIRKLTHQFLG